MLIAKQNEKYEELSTAVFKLFWNKNFLRHLRMH